VSLIEAPTTENRFLTWTSWDGYLKFLGLLADRRIRITYDRGKLELMSPSPEHEVVKTIIGALLECLMEELEMRFRAGGSTTFRREALDRGMEPDECYWTTRLDELDVHEKDPERVIAPDLAVEVEVSRSALDRMGIHAALGVPEVWRWTPAEGGHVHVHQLSVGGVYEEHSTSRIFPMLPLDEFERHVRIGLEVDQSRAVRAFRAWVREHVISD